MGGSWQLDAQRTYIEDHLPSYCEHVKNGTMESNFWPDFEKSWFEKWPAPEPSPELIAEKKSLEKAQKAERAKMVRVSTFY